MAAFERSAAKKDELSSEKVRKRRFKKKRKEATENSPTDQTSDGDAEKSASIGRKSADVLRDNVGTAGQTRQHEQPLAITPNPGLAWSKITERLIQGGVSVDATTAPVLIKSTNMGKFNLHSFSSSKGQLVGKGEFRHGFPYSMSVGNVMYTVHNAKGMAGNEWQLVGTLTPEARDCFPRSHTEQTAAARAMQRKLVKGGASTNLLLVFIGPYSKYPRKNEQPRVVKVFAPAGGAMVIQKGAVISFKRHEVQVRLLWRAATDIGDQLGGCLLYTSPSPRD